MKIIHEETRYQVFVASRAHPSLQDKSHKKSANFLSDSRVFIFVL